MKKTTKINVAAALAVASLAAAAVSAINVEPALINKKESAEIESPIEDITPIRGDNSPTYRDRKAKQETRSFDDVAASPVYNWYCKHTTGGARPDIPSEMSFIENYDGYFLGGDDKVIYLTFDAGYENGNIEKILDVLKAENVPGAFFILDNLALKNSDLVKRMAEEGHAVCNHTAKHRDMTNVSAKEEFAAELAKMEQVYKDTTGCEMAKYYRPPEGKFNEANMQWASELGYKTIFWSFAYADWDNNNQMSTEKAKQKILDSTHNGEVLLLHPTSATNAAIMSDLIKEWKDMGYRFGTLDELTGVADGK